VVTNPPPRPMAPTDGRVRSGQETGRTGSGRRSVTRVRAIRAKGGHREEDVAGCPGPVQPHVPPPSQEHAQSGVPGFPYSPPKCRLRGVARNFRRTGRSVPPQSLPRSGSGGPTAFLSRRAPSARFYTPHRMGWQLLTRLAYPAVIAGRRAPGDADSDESTDTGTRHVACWVRPVAGPGRHSPGPWTGVRPPGTGQPAIHGGAERWGSA